MAKISKEKLQYWIDHRCWKCGRHSQAQKYLQMVPKCGGYLCVRCYYELFDKLPDELNSK